MVLAMASSSRNGSNMSLLHPVWTNLPVELQEIILKHVPFESRVRFRAVCKRFNCLITSPKFARECQRQQARKPVPVIVRRSIPLDSSSIEIFNSETNSWLTQPMPILEASLYPLELCTTSGGLLCFVTKGCGRFVIYNPLTRAFRLLEFPYPVVSDICTLIRGQAAITGLVVDLQAGIFTLVIVITNKREAERKTFLYDSIDGSSRSGSPLPERSSFINTLTSNRSIYGLLYDDLRAVYRLLKYDVCGDSWSENSSDYLLYDDLPHDDLEILEHRCHVVLVSMITAWEDPEVHNYREIEVYRVRKKIRGHGETLVVDRKMCQVLRRRLDSFHGWTYAASGNGKCFITGIGDVICVISHTRPGYPMRVLHINCRSKKSSLLPECLTTKSDNWAHKEFKLKLLEPSLTVDL